MSGTLQDSLEHARVGADALSDPDDLDNAAILSWMKHHLAFSHHHHRYVIGTELLPPRWRAEILPMSQSEDALRVLRPLKHDHVAMAGLRRALETIAPQLTATDDAVIAGMADALSTARAWIICDARKPVTLAKTDPAVYAKLNGEGGTRVDFAYLSRWERNQALRGYVPLSKGITAGASGMTVATGFDVGQID